MPRTDREVRIVRASPASIFAAFTADKLMKWLPPAGMTGRVLEYELREGGRYRYELTYTTETGRGKSSTRSDVSSGRFVVVEHDRRIVQTVEFESDDPAFAGEMCLTWSFDPTSGGTRVSVIAENVPIGIQPDEHAKGIRSTLANLAPYVEGRLLHVSSVLACGVNLATT